jgi:hypothetical protein
MAGLLILDAHHTMSNQYLSAGSGVKVREGGRGGAKHRGFPATVLRVIRQSFILYCPFIAYTCSFHILSKRAALTTGFIIIFRQIACCLSLAEGFE